MAKSKYYQIDSNYKFTDVSNGNSFPSYWTKEGWRESGGKFTIYYQETWDPEGAVGDAIVYLKGFPDDYRIDQNYEGEYTSYFITGWATPTEEQLESFMLKLNKYKDSQRAKKLKDKKAQEEADHKELARLRKLYPNQFINYDDYGSRD